MEDHPYGDFLSAGTILLHGMENIKETFIEIGKKEALKEKAEDSRKKNIKSSSLSAITSNKKTLSAVPSKLEQVANQMNLSPSARKHYFKMMASKKPTVDVEG